MYNLKLPFGKETISLTKSKDQKRLLQSQKAASEIAKRERKANTFAQAKKQDTWKQKEGVQYASGEFHETEAIPGPSTVTS